jgi:hypothetical protein
MSLEKQAINKRIGQFINTLQFCCNLGTEYDRSLVSHESPLVNYKSKRICIVIDSSHPWAVYLSLSQHQTRRLRREGDTV